MTIPLAADIDDRDDDSFLTITYPSRVNLRKVCHHTITLGPAKPGSCGCERRTKHHNMRMRRRMKLELMFRNLYHVMADWALVIIAARTRCEGSSLATLGVLPDYGHPLRSNIPDKLSS
jgi:hypothetical protein